MSPALFIIAIIFYLLLLSGALIRLRAKRDAATLLQCAGVALPLVPCAVIPLTGFNELILLLYGCAWLPMGVGYVVEGVSLAKSKRW